MVNVTPPNEILDQALALPDDERTRVALELLDSIEPPDPLADLDDEAWVEEIRRRAERAASGDSKGTAWSEVKRLALEQVGR